MSSAIPASHCNHEQNIAAALIRSPYPLFGREEDAVIAGYTYKHTSIDAGTV
jgi:hypothetical protein